MIFLEPKRVYNGPFDGHHDRPIVPWSKHPLGEVPEGHYTIDARHGPHPPRGRRPDRARLRHARPRRRRRPPRSSGIDAEIIDLRTLVPLDVDTIVASVRQDRPLPGRPRGDADVRLRRRAVRDRPGAVLLPPRGADHAGVRLGHARTRTPTSGSYFPGPRPRRPRRCARWSTAMSVLPDEAARRRRGRRRGRARRVAASRSATRSRPTSVLAEVLTDKATVEVSSPVAGVVAVLHGEPGDVLAVGSDLVGIEIDRDGRARRRADTASRRPDDDRPPTTAGRSGAPAPTPTADRPADDGTGSSRRRRPTAAQAAAAPARSRRSVRSRRRRCGRGRGRSASTSPRSPAAGPTVGSSTPTSIASSLGSAAARPHRRVGRRLRRRTSPGGAGARRCAGGSPSG